MLCILLCQAGSLDNLHLVNLQNVDGEGGDDGRLTEALCRILTRQADDDVGTREDSPGVGALHRIPATGEIMTTVDALQGLIVGTLNAILHQHEGAPVQRLEIIQQFIAHAIRTSSYHDSYHILYLQRLLVHLTEKFHLGVGIGISLEISQILHIRILPAEEGLALLQLLRNRLPAVAIAGIERTVVAVRASSARDSSIPVRTGESCIYRNLLNPEVRKPLPDPGAKIIVVH